METLQNSNDQGELFSRRVTWEAKDQEIHPVRMIYLVIIKRSPTWTLFTHVKAKRFLLKSELRRIASSLYKVPELNITVI